MSIAFNEIKGLAELLSRSKEVEVATREDAWLATTHVIAGQRIRTMTVDDFTILLQFKNPLIARQLPSPDALSFFLWVLSPEIERWHERKGWRRLPFTRYIERFQSYRHGRRVAKALKIRELQALEEKWFEKCPDKPFVLPEGCLFEKAIKDAFEYIDRVFLDKPASLKNGTESGLCYLTSWFDSMQSEYHLPTKEVWKMAMPVLFARLKAIQKRHNQKIPEFNEDRDKIFQNIMRGLNTKLYTEDDLREGRVDLENNRLKNN